MAKGVENNAKGKRAKLELRRRAIEWLGGVDRVRVFEAYAGSGTMWRECWRGAGEYVGCDVRDIYDPQRALYLAECERVLRSIDLTAFNVFDLDAFGSPWATAYVLAMRRQLAPGERVAIVTTDGAKLNARFGQLERTFAYLIGRKRHDDAAHANWSTLTVVALQRIAALMNADTEWTDVRDNYGPSACQVYAAAGLVGRGVPAQVAAEIAAEPGALSPVEPGPDSGEVLGAGEPAGPVAPGEAIGEALPGTP